MCIWAFRVLKSGAPVPDMSIEDDDETAARLFAMDRRLPCITRINMVRVMTHMTVSVEYGIHCLLWLVDAGDQPRSGRDLAEFQGISPSLVTKIFGKLAKAGIVRASDGLNGGYLLARAPGQISLLQVTDAIEGRKPLFSCQEIRGRCAAFGTQPPQWATGGVCSIHAVMLKAEKAMRDTLAGCSLADIGQSVARKAPAGFAADVGDWFDNRLSARGRRGEDRHDNRGV
jgi:Rrf2 family protein